ncbi:MAG: hypothetical protein PWQ24_1089 [Mesotoga sp.]|nr:hypothetical protein [Mesotoga sp.]
MAEIERDRLLAYFAGIGSSVIFGLSFLFTKNALEYTNPMYFLSYRFSVAFVTISLLRALGVIRVRPYKSVFKDLLLLSLVQPVMYFIFENVGVSLSTSSEAGILLSTIPIFVLIFARVFLKERLAAPQVFSVLTALLGIVLITAGKGLSAGGSVLGPIILLGSTVSAAFYNILSRKASVRFKAWEITYHMMTMGFISFTLIAVVTSLIKGQFSFYILGLGTPQVAIAALYLGTLSSVGAFFLINFMLSKLEASRSTVFVYLSTVVSLLAGVVFRGERFGPLQVIGISLILLGVWGANALARRKTREESK